MGTERERQHGGRLAAGTVAGQPRRRARRASRSPDLAVSERIALRLLLGSDLFDESERLGGRRDGVGRVRLRSLIRVSGADDADALVALLGDALLGTMRRLDAARTARVAADTAARHAELETALDEAVRAFALWMDEPLGTVIDERARFVDASERSEGSFRTPDLASEHTTESPERYGWDEKLIA